MIVVVVVVFSLENGWVAGKRVSCGRIPEIPMDVTRSAAYNDFYGVGD
jgi:hypothetical protein